MTVYFIRYLGFLLVTALLSACASLPINDAFSTAMASLRPADDDLPGWVRNPPQSDSELLAVGQGISFKSTQNNAHSELAAQIQIKVDSSVQLKQVKEGDYHNTVMKTESNSRVSELVLVNSHVVQREKVGANYYVLLSMDKSDLAQQLSMELDTDMVALKHALSRAKRDRFSSWWSLRQQQPVAERVIRNSRFLLALNGQVSQQANELLRRYDDRMHALSAARQVRLVDNSSIPGMGDIVGQQLLDEGILAKPGVGSDGVLELNAQYRRQRVGNEQYLDGELTISLRVSGVTASDQRFSKSTVVLSNQRQAQMAVQSALYQQVQKSDLMSLLLENQ